jgi:hypothetical protein
MDSNLPPVDISFSYAWWHHEYGLDFGEHYWLDPVRRTEQDRQMERLLYERFGDVGMGHPDPAPKPNISLCCHRFMPAVLGCEIRYAEDQAPAALARPAAPEEMLALTVPDVASVPVVQEAIRQGELLADKYGSCSGEINMGGPLNVASLTFGDDMLMACAAQPEVAHHVLDVVNQTIMAVYDLVSCRVEPAKHSASRRRLLLGNCPVPMLSPRTYRRTVQPHDAWFRQQAGFFVLHSCGLATPYLADYARLGTADPDVFEISLESDLCAARRTFPTSSFEIMWPVGDLATREPDEIDRIFSSLLQDAGPSPLIHGIWIAEAGLELHDDKVRHLLTYGDRLGGQTRPTNPMSSMGLTYW